LYQPCLGQNFTVPWPQVKLPQSKPALKLAAKRTRLACQGSKSSPQISYRGLSFRPLGCQHARKLAAVISCGDTVPRPVLSLRDTAVRPASPAPAYGAKPSRQS